ncbi:MAG TPA: TRAP transporter substrate-binding protein [Acetobacteraceae bacterium]|jgi:TRAP-type transport system periplasmic protein|nr:TRAP transporter substrate-binding protein [Acetobacteraceae bacterium]
MSRAISRKTFLAGAAAATGAAVLAPYVARAAKRYVMKFGIDLASDHPTTVHVAAAAASVKKATDGAVQIGVFPNSELGDDTHMLSDLRAGAIEMMGIGDNILATLVPSAAIDNVGFAFKDGTTAWTALDGAVGDIVRADIAKTGLMPMHAIWDEGFREITTSTRPIVTPADLKGFKIRVPPSPISLSLFNGLGAAPETLNVAELYTALQTHVVDGQENPLGNIETQKFYQVQKYCSMTNHMWVGYWMLVSGSFWSRLPANYRKIVADAFDAQAPLQRTANNQLNASLQAKLTQQGMSFNTPEIAPFRAKLVASGFYKEWQGKFGATLWSALEKYTGALA